MSYFELFSLAPGFAIDKNALSARFRQLQRQYHPDNFAGENDQAQALALQKASEINDAYQTLSKPDLRAQYLLKLVGVDISDEQKTLQDIDFLMEQMSLREELESIPERDDPQESIDHFTHKIKQAQQQLQDEFASLYEQKEFELAADTVRKLKFYLRLSQQTHQLEDKILDL